MLVAIDARCRGSEHVRQDKPLQDFSASSTHDHIGYIFVADGHGGEKYFRSEHGSQLASLAAAKEIKKIRQDLLFYIKKKKTDVIDKSLKNLCSKILIAWRKEVQAHFSEHPLTEDEERQCEALGIALPVSEEEIPTLYGSTLLAAAYFEQFGFWFALQIGDGVCIGIQETPATSTEWWQIARGKRIHKEECGSVLYPIAEDEEQGFGVTKSLCGKNADAEFRLAFGFGKLSGIAVMSDGMSDSFDRDKLPDFILRIQKNALADRERTKGELEAFLPKLSEQGSGDDVSLAGIFIHEEPENPGNGTAVSAEKQNVTQ